MSDADPAAPELPPDPDQRPASAALAVWVIAGIAWSAGAALLASAVVPVLAEVDGLPGWVRPAFVAVVAVACVLWVAVAPALRYRTWRYAIRPEEIDLLHGWLWRRRTVIPMARVQHVETERGVLENAFDVATVKVHTAAGSHSIPGLPDRAAAALRTEIARCARVADEV